MTHEWKRVKSGGTMAARAYLAPRRCSSSCRFSRTISRRRASEMSVVGEPSAKNSGISLLWLVALLKFKLENEGKMGKKVFACVTWTT